ncbi:uncharacterized protein B0T15DRAFT_513420 [Chaetomium strumarium]|uniref:Uncharacterized protein n=1 Tax=Chaetomium strumarium TaxID=1170767 RepID=A0AAJ0LZB9_9PEZI|nr:hypothetical protein B0T15DRAFT_513420 [Chaetomium strumarium]
MFSRNHSNLEVILSETEDRDATNNSKSGSSKTQTMNLATLQHLLAQDDLDEDQFLNRIWIGLLGVEALIVLGVALHGLVGAASSSRLLARRRRSSAGIEWGSMSPAKVERGLWPAT